MRTIVAERTEEETQGVTFKDVDVVGRCSGQQQSRRAHGQGKALNLHVHLPRGRSLPHPRSSSRGCSNWFPPKWSKRRSSSPITPPGYHIPLQEAPGATADLEGDMGVCICPWLPSLVLTGTLTQPSTSLLAMPDLCTSYSHWELHYCYQP